MREWLVNIRKNKDLTQKQVAEKCGISRSYYADIEQGTRNPKAVTAQAIGHELGFDWTHFFVQNGRKTRHNDKNVA
ncbi:hypothetical protein B1748_23725 [Paenibacillus sp. MY03]|uniref:helix-turn-helix transcriptional regulator n=1 Tax=Paenibacillus sp. MY03 TaxID=302980 RepID=UPI000B3C1BB7|nr:helix-turn-helix transcriptional regulator [Paenibacillus sp. MY03]OUS73019.1 hypothetical protein B1748_23725 [Paenibacillus sp. MY03]